jgi:hypothetical protein
MKTASLAGLIAFMFGLSAFGSGIYIPPRPPTQKPLPCKPGQDPKTCLGAEKGK